MKTNNGLVEYAKAYVGSPYWFGTFGQTSTPALLRAKQRQYPSYYVDNDFTYQLNLRVHDCVGLIKGYLWRSDLYTEPKYDPKQDISANGMYKKSTMRGIISTMPSINGILVYKGKTENSITHVGIYCTDGYVYEAKGHRYGVVKTKFNMNEWNFWSMCPYITYDGKDKNITKTNIAKEVIAGKYGNGAKRKQALKDLGYDPDEIQKIVNELLK